jgi:hypothetical protein
MLYFRPRSTANATWYIDISEPEIEQSIDSLYNSVYAVYSDPSNQTLRSTVNTDVPSVIHYGLTRQMALSVNSTSSIQAGLQRDAALADKKTAQPRVGIVVHQLYDAQGNWWPAYYAQAGDTVIIRNFPPTLSTSIDRIRIMRIVRTNYNGNEDSMTIEPESPIPTLQVLLAKQALKQ